MKKLFLAFIFISIYGCSTRSASEEALQLQDSLFHVKITAGTELNTQSLNAPLSKLTKIQKSKLVVPVIKQELNIDSNYIMEYMNAQFISKQTIVNNFSALNIRVNGDDYDAIFYVIVNDSGKLVSWLRLSGGLCAGPNEIKKGAVKLCPVRYSVINNSVIQTYVITETAYSSTSSRASLFDSVYYKSTIHSNGLIDTRRMDSVRFTASRK